MKRVLLLYICLFFLFTAGTVRVEAQCSICTRTAQQMGEQPAKALNRGILYLAFAPLTIIGFIGFRWWRSQSPEHGSSEENR